MKIAGQEMEVGNHKVGPGIAGVREAVRNEVKHGVDWVKFITDYNDLATEGITRIFDNDEVAAFVDESHALGKPVTAHAIGDEGAHAAVISGVDSIEHGLYISESTAREMKKRGTWLIPTLTLLDMFDDENFDVSKTSTSSPNWDLICFIICSLIIESQVC